MSLTRNKQRKERLLNVNKKGQKQNSKEKKEQKAKEYDDDMIFLKELEEENKKLQQSQTETPLIETEEKTPKKEYPLNDISYIKHADEMAEHMSKVYQLILAFKNMHPEFEKETDKKKVDIITDKLALGKIIEIYPIVTRYMICFGQFSEKAFREFLRQCENSKDDPVKSQKTGYRDDKWCQLQANYVTMLWKEYNKYRHPSEAEKKMVWNQTYQLLKKTFTDMKNKHKEAEKIVKEEKQVFAAENFKEYLERVQNGKQTISTEDEQKLKLMLENIIYKGKMQEVFDQLKKKISEIEPVFIRVGRLSEHEAERRQRNTIKMTEYVDAERMQEIPDKYKPDELKGMEMVPIEDSEEIDGIEVEEWVEEIVDQQSQTAVDQQNQSANLPQITLDQQNQSADLPQTTLEQQTQPTEIKSDQ